MRYFYNISDNKVVCVSHYAGKPVRGIAKCDPSDEFDEEKGIELAQARCDEKIAVKRVKRAELKYCEAVEEFERAKSNLERMQCYLEDSTKELVEIRAHLDELERTF